MRGDDGYKTESVSKHIFEEDEIKRTSNEEKRVRKLEMRERIGDSWESMKGMLVKSVEKLGCRLRNKNKKKESVSLRNLTKPENKTCE